MSDQHRAPLTEDDITNRKIVFDTWTVQARDGLVPLNARIDIDRKFREWTRRTPQFAIDWAVGIASTLIQSLPEDDPWRVPDPTMFGTWHDGEDLALESGFRSVEQVRLDLDLTAIADRMPAGAARTFAACAQGFEQGREYLTWRYITAQRCRDASTVDVAQAVVSWALWRRRCYIPHSEDADLLEILEDGAVLARRLELGDPIEDDVFRVKGASLVWEWSYMRRTGWPET